MLQIWFMLQNFCLFYHNITLISLIMYSVLNSEWFMLYFQHLHISWLNGRLYLRQWWSLEEAYPSVASWQVLLKSCWHLNTGNFSQFFSQILISLCIFYFFHHRRQVQCFKYRRKDNIFAWRSIPQHLFGSQCEP